MVNVSPTARHHDNETWSWCPGVSRSQVLLVKHALLLACTLLTVTRKACKTCEGYEMFHFTFSCSCQYSPSQLLYSRNRPVHLLYLGCPCVAMDVMFVALLSATCSHWPRQFPVAQPSLPRNRAWAEAPKMALLAVREPGREPFSSPSAALQSAKKR